MPPTPSTQHPQRPRRLRRLAAVLVFALALLAALELSGLRGQLSLQALHQGFEAHVVTGTLAFMALFALGNLAQVPGWIFLAAAVLALGRVGGGLVTYAAACASCVVTFVLVRLVGGDALRGIGGRRTAWLFAQLERHPVRSIALLRMLLQTLPALNYALSLSGVRFRYYLLGTLLGLPLPIALYALFFEGAAALFGLPHY